jgi:hypothetical protein
MVANWDCEIAERFDANSHNAHDHKDIAAMQSVLAEMTQLIRAYYGAPQAA